MIKYCLRKAVLDPVPEIEISAQEFNDLKVARGTLHNAFEIEQTYEIVIFNFLELEKEVINNVIKNTIRQLHSYSEVFDTLSSLNVRFVNLLTATKLYLDQTPQHLSKCGISQDNFKDLLKSKLTKEYDTHLGYRFMEALRNHVQHHGTAVHIIRPNARWTSYDDKGLMEYSLNIFTKRSDLQENGKFKKSVLKEIPEEVDLVATARQYIQSISCINEFVRGLVSKDLTNARATIESAHKRYSEIYSETLIGLSALEIKDSKTITSVPLLLDWDDVRVKLQNRNPKLSNLTKSYVTHNVKKKVS